MGKVVEMMKAQPYIPYNMGSFGKAEYMLIRQHKFPAKWEMGVDVVVSADSDRILGWDYDGFRKTLSKYVGSGELAIGEWAKTANSDDLMAFIKEALKVEEIHPGVEFTGCRVLGTVNRSNGFPIYSLEVFANKSGQKEYSEGIAPNVHKLKAGDMIFAWM